MTQVALFATPAMPVADAREAAVDGGTAGDGGDAFSDIFKGLGEKQPPEGSRPDGAAERRAAPKERGAGLSAGSGLHRLLASGRLVPSSDRIVPSEAKDADPAIGAIDDGDAPAVASGRKETGEKLLADDGGNGNGDVSVAMPSPVTVPVMPALADSRAAEAPPAKAAKHRDDGSETKSGERPARGVVVVTPDAEDGTPAAPVRVPVTVESVETHFAPVAMTHAAVAAAVVGAMRPASSGAPPVAGKGAVKPVEGAARKADSIASGNPMPAGAGAAELAETAIEVTGVAPDGGTAEGGAQRPDAAPADAAMARKAAPVVQSEAVPAPTMPAALPAATLRQFGDAIAGAAADMASEAAAAPVQDGGGSPRAVVKVLNIRLDPPEYGQVSVRLTLQGGALSVQMRAERETTAAALDHDREKLAEHLKASGYGTDVTLIDTRRDMAVMRSDGSANAGGGTGSGTQGGSGPASGGQANGGLSGDGQMARRGGNGGGGFGRDRQEGRDGGAAPDTGAGGLYV